ncbi:MAG: type II toxin-antitoxin system VapC family toxin [Cellulomonas sp.]|uniref:type II toxin-antitoxin system VapC family toxin n=1 Tax=Cellulomonas sp. TaxID=40001 RepID=UPI0019EAED29|nr:type II toxin-antitoxin system VapC family toxin [Cellulomonas sp.]MBF0686990.1 type II toxin-antitoxin system VapC family toxin [Cellulomonas sp.]
MTAVLDASAVLAFLAGEPGADVVEEALAGGTVCSAVNWSEVAQKIRAGGGDWSVASALLASYGLSLHDATARDGEAAAALWQRGSGLSLADRFCLALANRLDVVALTADTAWGSSERVRQIR